MRIKHSPLLKCCIKAMRRQGVFNFTSELGDFSSCILEKYQEKVVEQTLFDNFDPNVCTVLQYLCSLSYLEKCYKSFRRRESAVSCRSLSENVGGKTNTTLGDTIASDEMTSDEKLIRHERCKKVTALLESLNSMIVHCPAPGTVVYNQTGLQLYPRLSTTNPEMVKLCDFSQAFVANTKNVSQSESDDVIRKTHVAAQTKWNRKYEEISGKLYRSTLSGLAKRREWRDQINEIFAEQYFRPLEPPAISDLCGVSIDIAYTYRSRYRKQYKKILSKYFDQLDALRDDMEENTND